MKSHRGRSGGYSISNSPNELTVKDVYRALGDVSSTPFYTVPSTGVKFYIIQIINKAERSFQEELNDYTIQDILDIKKRT